MTETITDTPETRQKMWDTIRDGGRFEWERIHIDGVALLRVTFYDP